MLKEKTEKRRYIVTFSVTYKVTATNKWNALKIARKRFDKAVEVAQARVGEINFMNSTVVLLGGEEEPI